MKFLIADDHTFFRLGVKEALVNSFSPVATKEVGLGQDVINAVHKEDFDLVILDISFPDKDGLDVLAELKLLQPNLPVVILSFYSEEQYGLHALKAGGAAYLTKGSSPEEFVDCVTKVLDGGKYVSQRLAELLANVWGEDTKIPLYQQLSNRELQILQLISQGKTPTEIAKKLCLSVKTISTYRARLLAKLKLNSTADLIRFTFENHLFN